MPIPDFQSFFLPLLRLCSDGDEHSIGEAYGKLGEDFKLTEEEKRQVLPSGRQTTIHNRVSWAKTFLVKALLLEVTRRGHFKITKRGMDVISENPKRLDNKYLSKFEEFQEFRRSIKNNSEEEEKEQSDDSERTPAENLEYAYLRIRQDLAEELLDNVKKCSPDFFEKLVVEVLVAMGYGGSRKDAGETIGRSGDGGIDGIIKEDRLGLDIIYIQAKRWENVIGRPEIQKFVGALQGQRARKGVFITTSSYTKDALDYARNLESKVVLIDGGQLANLMIDFDIGVSGVGKYEVKRIDSDYFSEE